LTQNAVINRILEDDELALLLDENPQIISSQSLLHFGVTFFPHLVTSAPSDFHYEVTDSMGDIILGGGGSFNACAAPRGFAKTTWITVIMPLWTICYGYKTYLVTISAAATNAESMLDNVKHELISNKELRVAFPNACGEGPVWRSNMIVTNNGIRVDALGSGQQVRGRNHHGNRPDLIILDDVETDENVLTPEQRAKLLRWYQRAVSKAGSPRTDYVVIGTVLHTESLLATLLTQTGYTTRKYKAIISWSDRKDLWDYWQSLLTNLNDTLREKTALNYFKDNEREMLRGTKVLWPEGWSYYSLMIEYVRDGPYAFSSERQNDPTEADALITRDQITWYNPQEINPHTLEWIGGGVDPSLGKTKRSDFSAIIHVGMDGMGIMYCLSASIARRKPDDIIKDVLDLTKRRHAPWDFPFRTDAFLVEAVAFQSYFASNLDRAAGEETVYLPTMEVHPRANKIVRISSLQPLIKNGWLRFRNDGTQETLIQQLCNFPHGNDDGPDCLAMITEYVTQNKMIGTAITVPYNTGYAYGQY